MQDLNDLYYFVQVVNHSGFAQCGRALDIPKSRLSRRIAELEHRLGLRLLQRSTRSFSVTEIGQEYYTQCLSMLAGAEAAQAVIDRMQAEPQGTVRVAAPPALIDYGIGDMIARFMSKRPRVHVYLKSSNRPVDVLRESFDLALRVRFGPIEDSELIMKPLGHSRQKLVASPDLIRQHTLRSLEDLASLPSVALGSDVREMQWNIDDGKGRPRLVQINPRLVTDDMMALKSAALQGVGVAVLPLLMVHEELRQGTLIDVCPTWRPEQGHVHAVFPSRRGLVPAVRELLEFLGNAYREIEREELRR
ncbi:LysR substrate-binding domain-containing protein [Achromobacter pestifer]